jgi:hypothetical protein
MKKDEFVLSNPSLSMGTEVIMLATSIYGVLLNALAVYIVHYKLKSRNACTWLMSIIGLADILVALVIITTELAKFATRYQILINNDFCQYTGMLMMLLTMTTIDGVGLLSLIRALSIVRNIEINSIYYYVAMGLMFLYNTVINIIGVANGIMRVMPSEVYCMAGFTVNSYAKTFSLLLLSKFVLMIIILIVSYTCITVKYYQIINPLNSNSVSSECFIGDNRTFSYQMSIIYKLLSLMLLYLICFVPQLVTIAYNVATKTTRTPVIDSVIAMTMNFTIMVNAIFVLFYQRDARIALISMLPDFMRPNNRNQKPMENLEI